MNHWAQWLADAPALHQRLIARAQRISQPRRVTATERVARLRRSLCHASTVRAVFELLDADERAAVADLRARRRGISAAELTARYGAIRPLRQIAADIRPQSMAERLLLRGWLFPRADARGRPVRWLLPPELRRWLPVPLALGDAGPAPMPSRPPALRAAAVLLQACALQPLAVRASGQLRRKVLRTLVPQLAPLSSEQVAALLLCLLPILERLNLLVMYNGMCMPTPAARRFLEQSDAEQLAQLVGGWVGLPGPDALLARHIDNLNGIYWGLLRRRLWAWAAALPLGRLIDPAMIAPALTATLGPLADSQTHGFRTVVRTPWRARRSAAIIDAALRGPLAWLGAVAWHEGLVSRPGALPAVAPGPRARARRGACIESPPFDQHLRSAPNSRHREYTSLSNVFASLDRWSSEHRARGGRT